MKKKSRFWSIILDESTDVAPIERTVIVVRYLDGNKVRKDFIKFIDAYDLFTKILEVMVQVKVKIKNHENISYLERT